MTVGSLLTPGVLMLAGDLAGMPFMTGVRDLATGGAADPSRARLRPTAPCSAWARTCSTCSTPPSARSRACAAPSIPAAGSELTCEHENGAVSQASLSGSVAVPRVLSRVDLFGSTEPLVHDTAGIDHEECWRFCATLLDEAVTR